MPFRNLLRTYGLPHVCGSSAGWEAECSSQVEQRSQAPRSNGLPCLHVCPRFSQTPSTPVGACSPNIVICVPKGSSFSSDNSYWGQLSTQTQRSLSKPALSVPTGKPCIMLPLVCCATYLCPTSFHPTQLWISSLACLHQKVIPPYSPLPTDFPRLFISFTWLNSNSPLKLPIC